MSKQSAPISSIHQFVKLLKEKLLSLGCSLIRKVSFRSHLFSDIVWRKLVGAAAGSSSPDFLYALITRLRVQIQIDLLRISF